jgi:amidase
MFGCAVSFLNQNVRRDKEEIRIVMFFTHKDVRNISSVLGTDANNLDLELNTKFMSVAGSGISHEDIEESFAIWKKSYNSISALHQVYDVILTPTVATPPLEGDALDPSVIEKLAMKIMIGTGLGKKVVNEKSLDMAIDKSLYVTPFTPIANITGQPAMSVPLYWDNENMPHGAQFMADVGKDSTLLMLAHELEEAYPWVKKIPNEISLQ